MPLFLVRYNGHALDLLDLEPEEVFRLRSYGVDVHQVPEAWSLKLDWAAFKAELPSAS